MNFDLDRAAGAYLGLALGDALGAGYEFGPAMPQDYLPFLKGGGPFNWAPGETTDDTALAQCILQAALLPDFGKHLSTDLERVAANFVSWFNTNPPDVGNATRGALANATAPLRTSIRNNATVYHRYHPRSAGNGSLMRCAAVVLPFLHQPTGPAHTRRLTVYSRAISNLTHGDPLTGDACVLWAHAIDTAIRTGNKQSVLTALSSAAHRLPVSRRKYWAGVIDTALSSSPYDFTPNGFVVTAFQAALSAFSQATASEEPCTAFKDGVYRAVRVGDDTDTVGAIAGSLLGALYGVTAIPLRWRHQLHGFNTPSYTHYVRLAATVALQGNDSSGWPGNEYFTLLPYYQQNWPDTQTPYSHPLSADPGLIISNVSARVEADATVSLARMGLAQLKEEHYEVWLPDGPHPNLDFILRDTVDLLFALRSEGKTVHLHCVQGSSRTPIVAALYLSHLIDIPPIHALKLILSELRQYNLVHTPVPALSQALRRLG